MFVNLNNGLNDLQEVEFEFSNMYNSDGKERFMSAVGGVISLGRNR